MIWVLLIPRREPASTSPPSTCRVSSMKNGIEMRRSSSTSTNLLPSFSGRSIAIGSHSMHPESMVRSFRFDKPRIASILLQMDVGFSPALTEMR
jgi:hypothetical protein